MDNTSQNRHDLRKQLKLLKLTNMKAKKQLRMAMRVRFLNRIRLEGDITELNSLVSSIQKAISRNDESVENISSNNDFQNPESKVFREANSEKDVGSITPGIFSLPVKATAPEYKFFCDKCDFKCKKRTPFDIHARRHSGERPYACGVCDRSFVAKYELKLHSAKHAEGKKYNCDRCNYTTYRTDMLVNHREKHFGIIAISDPNERNKILHRRKLRQAASKANCLACERTNQSKVTGSHSDSVKTCADENDATRAAEVDCKVSLRNAKHTCQVSWICDFCGSFFKKKESLNKHLRTHSGLRPYRCDQCPYSAATKHTLIIHIRKHSGEKPYSCDECSFRCTTKGYLRVHKNNHRGIKPFSCKHCAYRSVDSCKLSSHISTKHGIDDTDFSLRQNAPVKLYECLPCKKTFSNESAHKRHSARVHPPAQTCHLCEYTTTATHDLKRHKKTHEREHVCKICHYRTSQNSVFIRHMETQHPPTRECSVPPVAASTMTSNIYSLSPVILNIPAMQAIRAHEQHAQGVVPTVNPEAFPGHVGNFYWTTHP